MTLRAAKVALRAMDNIDGALTIVDNDSQDGSYEMLSAAIVDQGLNEGNVPVRVLQSGRNGGYGAGNNVGIRAGLPDGSKPDFYYVLNSDAFPEDEAIQALMNHLISHPQTGFAGSYIQGEARETHLTTFRFPSIASEFEEAIRFGPVTRLLKNFKVPLETPEHTCSVDWLAGASLMMRREALDQAGLFDEDFFLYFDEVDLCRRAARTGWRTDFVAESVVTHIGSVSTGMNEWARVPGYWFDSRLHYFVKNHGPLYASIATSLHILGGSLDALRCKLKGCNPGKPPHFLRTLALHDIKAAINSISFWTKQQSKRDHTQPKE